MAGPKMTDQNLLRMAGFYRSRHKLPMELKEDIKKFLRIIDEQDACNRYKWFNLPCNITSQELERLLYYKGQLCFFYMKDTDEFYFLPYALNGTIDVYGRYNTVKPVPISDGLSENSKKQQADLLGKVSLNVAYGVMLEEPEDIEEYVTSHCVLLHDYTKQLPQTIISRQQINEPIIDIMADCIPFMRTCLIKATGVAGWRVADADQREAVAEASQGLYEAALSGEPWVAVEGGLEFQDMAQGQVAKAEEFMLAMQSLDNLRLSSYGLDNGGLFEKKAHTLESENAVNQVNVGLVFQDGLSIRQNFCNIVNSIFGLGIWCEASENASGIDYNGDGTTMDDDPVGQASGVEEGGSGDEDSSF